MLKVKFSKLSERFLKRCNLEIYERITKKIKKLSEEPFPSNSVRITNRKEKVFRVRVGYYRIIYALFKEKNLLFISEINKRSRIYN